MKLDATELRYITNDEFRVLTAVDMGSKNHEVVPSQLIAQIAGLRSGGINKILGELARRSLVARVQNAKYEGYRLTYGGYDYLALRTFAKRDVAHSVGNQIGTGKESDIYVVADPDGNQRVLKIHRLGRVSFRAIKSKRDYLQKRKSASWMYMSRLAATKEFAFMKVLHEHGFPVPKPYDQARHCLVMELIDSFPLRQIDSVPNPGALYSALMELIVRLARSGLIHGDFNEFNILIRNEGDEEGNNIEPVLIDFPQMVSTSHANAEYYFNRDVACIRAFFSKRFRYESTVYPKFSTIMRDGRRDFDLDVQVEASGFTKGHQAEIERYLEVENEDGENEDSSSELDTSGDEDQDSEAALEHADPEEEEVDQKNAPRAGPSSRADEPGPIEGVPQAMDSLNINRDEPEEDSASEGETAESPRTSIRDVPVLVSSSIARDERVRARKNQRKNQIGKPKGSKMKSDIRRNNGDF